MPAYSSSLFSPYCLKQVPQKKTIDAAPLVMYCTFLPSSLNQSIYISIFKKKVSNKNVASVIQNYSTAEPLSFPFLKFTNRSIGRMMTTTTAVPVEGTKIREKYKQSLYQIYFVCVSVCLSTVRLFQSTEEEEEAFGSVHIISSNQLRMN